MGEIQRPERPDGLDFQLPHREADEVLRAIEIESIRASLGPGGEKRIRLGEGREVVMREKDNISNSKESPESSV